MESRPSKSDKKITSALTNEGKDRPQVKVAGQDCRASEDEAGNDPFPDRRVWSQTSQSLLNYRCRRSQRLLLATSGWKHIRANARVRPSCGRAVDSLLVHLLNTRRSAERP